jgi:hypothetical protein
LPLGRSVLFERVRTERAKLSRHAEVAKAMDYILKRWTAFTRFLADGPSALATMRQSVRCAALH